MNALPLSTRKEFIATLAGATLLAQAAVAANAVRRLLIVVAHPDDEYAFAASTYRLVREAGWIADQITITDGESGYRYATLAEAYYGADFTSGAEARARLAAVRKHEAQQADKVLGIREHDFLDQKDTGFEADKSAAQSANWDRARVRETLAARLRETHYDAVFTLLPTPETHGHHRAATLLTLEAVASLAEEERPLVFGVEPRAKWDEPLWFAGFDGQPLTRTSSAKPVLTFNRCASFGYQSALNYQIVVNWVIAEHKSQGLFQADYGRHDLEEFWLFEVSGPAARDRIAELQRAFVPTARTHAG
jgi:LmbE family N-acetylglucosaminyl deacetylase